MTRPNRLAAETSLYLRQHADNPVDWFPWGPEALARAKELDRPIFLSVGYSACHWCHVMAHESFEDAATAAVLNEHFVCVKVDREERPDLDAIYMNAHHVLARDGGGWPLSVFLAPDLTPFYAGTYFPPDDRYAHHGKPSFRRVLVSIIDAWTTDRAKIAEVGRNVTQFLAHSADLHTTDTHLDDDILRAALAALQRNFDAVNGGFGHAPKFPHALELRLLLRIAHRFDDPQVLRMARLTLDKMARGGVYDQIGGGFARYSVDARWLVPHFEKMLYDNALLATAYVEGWQATGDPFYEQVARETLDYVWDEMTCDGGAFYSTEDADSEGEEGKFYVWSETEIRAALGPELGEFACRVWGVTAEGNFEGHNVLSRARPDADDADRLGLTPDDFRAKLVAAKEKLWQARSVRVRPGRDEKILTAWNGLMIAAFARAGAAFGDGSYVSTAATAADWCLDHLRDEHGRLFRTATADGDAKLAGYLEDYAFLADGLVTLYEAEHDAEYLRAAVELADAMLTHFADPAGAGFFFTADDHEPLIARTKEQHDGSTPAGVSVAVTVLLRLAKLTGRRDFADKAAATLRGYRDLMEGHPTALGQMLVALDFHLGPVEEVVVVGQFDEPDTQDVLREFHRRFRPHQVLAARDIRATAPTDLLPLLADRPAVNGVVTTYICRDRACAAPLVGAEAVAAYLGGGVGVAAAGAES